jgi:hypothetical protein
VNRFIFVTHDAHSYLLTEFFLTLNIQHFLYLHKDRQTFYSRKLSGEKKKAAFLKAAVD